MGGSETSAGTLFQARIAALVLAHMLAERPLGWLTGVDDTPTWLSAETGGPGDDLAVGVRDARQTLEVQAKHGLIGPKAVGALLSGIVSRQQGRINPETIIAVDQTASPWIRGQFARDLQSRRVGRPEVISSHTRKLMDGAPGLTERLTVQLIHVDDHDNAHRQTAVAVASGKLAATEQMDLLWSILEAHGHALAAGRLRVDRTTLLELLVAKGIKITRPAGELRLAERLDEVKLLLESGDLDAARALLDIIAAGGIGRAVTDLRVRYLNNRGVVAYRLGDVDSARNEWHAVLAIVPTHPGALCNLANLERETGNPSGALEFVERALASDPQNATAWSQRLWVLDSLERRGDAPKPPAEIESGVEYQAALAMLAAEDEQWAQARAHSLAAVQQSETTEALFVRAMVLASAPAESAAVERDELGQAERFASRVLERIRSPADSRRRFALVLRAGVRRELERDEEAAVDLGEAGEGGYFDPNRVRMEASAHVSADRPSAALAVLTVPEVDKEPVLLALRAEIRLLLKDDEGARRDFDTARMLLERDNVSAENRIAVATLAARLGQVAVADSALAPLDDSQLPRAIAARGIVALAKENWSAGIDLFRRAIDKAGASERDDMIRVCLWILVDEERWDEVIAWTAEFQLRGDADGAKYLARALTERHRYREVDELLRGLRELKPQPRWALGLAWHIAERRSDPENALVAVRAIRDSGEDSPHLLLAEARYLAMLDRSGDARGRMEELRKFADTLEPSDGATATAVAAALGLEELADEFAFLAYRRDPLNSRNAQALMSRLIPGVRERTQPTVIAANTSATLVDAATDTERIVVVLDRADTDIMRNEYAPQHQLVAQLLGRAVGATIVLNEGSAFARTYTVKEVLPAWVPAVRDLLLNAEERFPEKPMARRVDLGSKPGIDAVARIAQATQERTSFVRELMAHYGDGKIPLSMVSESAQIPLAELIDALTTPGSTEPLYTVEAHNRDFYAAVAVARDADAFVVTLDAALAVDIFVLYDAIAKCGKSVIAPRSLAWTIAQLETEARKAIDRGRQSFVITPDGTFRMVAVPRDALVAAHRRYERIKLWVESNASLQSRPLSALERDGDGRDYRAAVGDSVIDAVELAADGVGALYTDDLVMRRIAEQEFKCKCFSTVTLVESLADRGTPSAPDRSAFRVQAVRRRLNFVALDPATITAAARDPSGAYESTRLLLERCAAPHVELDVATSIAAVTCRQLAVESVQHLTPAAFARLALNIFSARWPRRDVLRALNQRLRVSLALLPTVLDAVDAGLKGNVGN